jgi:hypothetical protein
MIVAAFGLAALGLLAVPRTAHAQAATTTTIIDAPLTTTVSNACTGELITFTGQSHLVIHTTATAAGTFETTIHSNLQDVSGTSAPSGATYRFQAASTTVTTVAPGSETTTVIEFRVIGPGADNNLLVRVVHHLTVAATGSATATVDSFSVTCR